VRRQGSEDAIRAGVVVHHCHTRGLLPGGRGGMEARGRKLARAWRTLAARPRVRARRTGEQGTQGAQ